MDSTLLICRKIETMLKKNEIVTVEVVDLTHGRRGGGLRSMAWSFVENALPGEVIHMHCAQGQQEDRLWKGREYLENPLTAMKS